MTLKSMIHNTMSAVSFGPNSFAELVTYKTKAGTTLPSFNAGIARENISLDIEAHSEDEKMSALGNIPRDKVLLPVRGDLITDVENVVWKISGILGRSSVSTKVTLEFYKRKSIGAIRKK